MRCRDSGACINHRVASSRIYIHLSEARYLLSFVFAIKCLLYTARRVSEAKIEARRVKTHPIMWLHHLTRAGPLFNYLIVTPMDESSYYYIYYYTITERHY